MKGVLQRSHRTVGSCILEYIPLLCTAVISLKHSLHVLSSFPPPSPPPETTLPSPVTRDTRWGEQDVHTTRPHRRQWCFRWNAENLVEQIIHSLDIESGTHTGRVITCCWLSDTAWVGVRSEGCVGCGWRRYMYIWKPSTESDHSRV